MLLVNTNNVVACVGNEISELSDGTFSCGDTIYYDKTLQLITDNIPGTEIGDTYANGMLTKKINATPIESEILPEITIEERIEVLETIVEDIGMNILLMQNVL